LSQDCAAAQQPSGRAPDKVLRDETAQRKPVVLLATETRADDRHGTQHSTLQSVDTGNSSDDAGVELNDFNYVGPLDQSTLHLIQRSEEMIAGNVSSIKHANTAKMADAASVGDGTRHSTLQSMGDEDGEEEDQYDDEEEEEDDDEEEEEDDEEEEEDDDEEEEDEEEEEEEEGTEQTQIVQDVTDDKNTENGPKMPHSLGDREWENEVARNIVSLYSTTLHHEKTAERIDQSSGAKAAASNRPVKMRSSTKPSSKASRSSSNLTTAGSMQPPRLLPALKKSGPVRSVGRSWQPSHKEGDQVVVNLPPMPTQIWFTGSGTVAAVWDALARPGEAEVVVPNAGDLTQPKLCGELQLLETRGKYKKYVAVVEGLLLARFRERGVGPLESRLWVQLTVSCNAFGMRYTDQKKYGKAMELLKKAEELAEHHAAVDVEQRPQLLAFVYDSYAYYYYRRGKANAALQAVNKAMRTHLRREEWAHVAKCHLHTACILARIGRHDESARCMGQVLIMVEKGQLEAGGASAQKICMVAVCYHNIAVQQLQLRRFTEACISSQNARRLARLSLSYSNKWLKTFESTHKACLAALAAENQQNTENSEQASLFKNLTQALYT
jgi:tetratricopeptide (TPR) repeat protein